MFRGLGLSLLLLLLCTSAAQAASTTLVFNGPMDPSGQRFGVSLNANPLDPHSTAGIPIVAPPIITDATGMLDVVSQMLDLGSITRSAPGDPPMVTATSSWQVQNVGTTDMFDAYVLFVTTDPVDYIVNGSTITVSYLETNVGLTLDTDEGWALVRAVDPVLGDFYYPAISVGNLAAGEFSDLFEVNYTLFEELQGNGSGSDVLPRLRIGAAFAPIPEPTSAVLMAAGLLIVLRAGRKEA